MKLVVSLEVFGFAAATQQARELLLCEEHVCQEADILRSQFESYFAIPEVSLRLQRNGATLLTNVRTEGDEE